MEEKKRGGKIVRDTIFGGQETISPGFEVPRQCSLFPSGRGNAYDLN
jgi:hypothetical protein